MELIFSNVWLIPALPFIVSMLLGSISFFLPSSIKNIRRFCFFISVSSLVVVMLISFHSFWDQITGNFIHRYLWAWIFSKNMIFRIGYLIDPLTSIMSVLVTTVGITVMIYSDSYMSHDRGYIRFFCYLGFFTAAMLGLVLSSNLIQIYIFWELVGMCSYLLIGFWFTRPGAANACQKAFITNRVGDFGLLLGILGFYSITGSFEFEDLPERLFNLFNHDQFSMASVNVYGILFFLGPIAKSAQFPLHVWLPDAMEGPTPISALIHAATMVAAGIFLVARMLPVLQMLPFVMDIISWVGIITASLGASIAMAQRDLKKGLAYSTMSQLGYMILSLGIGSYKASLFHLITHAYSKALLFLGAGSVIHSTESILGYHPSKSQNMNLMGGLRKYMPVTALTFLFGTLSLSGIPPFACFWSKDEILLSSWIYSPFLGFIASSTAVLTAYYMFRIYLLTFEGDFRGHFGNEHRGLADISIWGSVTSDRMKEQIENSFPVNGMHKKNKPCPKESDNIMLFALIALSIPTLFIGIIGIYINQEHLSFDSLSHWLYLSINPPNKNSTETFIESLLDSFPSIGLALIGISVAFFLYGPNKLFSISKMQKFAYSMANFFSSFFDSWSYHRGYIDGLYESFFVKSLVFLASIARVLDQWIIDGLVNGIGILSFFGGESLKYLEGGRISSYLFFLVSCMFLFSLYSYIT